MSKLRILVACEESQAVCIEFRKLGHEAFSCDLQPCSGGHPEWHFHQDVFEVIDMGWDLIIAFPPCTHLASSGAPWFEQKRKDGRQQQGIDFFMRFTGMQCKWAIENPVGIMSTHYRKPDQIIQPYQFGHPQMKTTCLWLNDLPKLTPTKIVEKEYIIGSDGKKYPKWSMDTFKLPKEIRAKERSKTFPGIAQAMASQWSEYLTNRL